MALSAKSYDVGMQLTELNMKPPNLRDCQDVRGMLGGSNAFHFLNLAAGILTLIVNINNNIQSNNLNTNSINANTNSQQNSNSNVNNNAANVIMVMPGKRRKKRNLEISDHKSSLVRKKSY